ncbi:MAG: glycosyltransferase family 9 protein [Lentisphaeria bacterium]|nr:glycosyltransferase family 9 protein [Lentisphaeria bacterium]
MTQEVQRILVVKPSSLGDILHVFPALALLRECYPKSEMDFLIHPAFAPVLDYSPFPVSRKILFERKKMGKLKSCLPEILKLCLELRREKYDLILDFQGLFRSAVFARWAARGAVVRGFAHPREPVSALFYSEKVDVPPTHAVERYVNMLDLPDHIKWNRSAFPLPENPQALASLTAKTGPLPPQLIALIPGARWESKMFPPELFAQIANHIAAHAPQTAFCVIGSKDDIALEEKIAGLLHPEVKLLSTAGKTSLAEMMELLRHSAAAVSNDSGPAHAAAALNIPVFSFFGSTDPEKTAPFCPQGKVYQLPLPCAKCLKRTCPQPEAEQLQCHKLDPEKIASDILECINN